MKAIPFFPVFVLLSVATFSPLVHAACDAPTIITTKASTAEWSLIWTEGWDPQYYEGTPYQTTPPVSPHFDAVFWALGVGNPVLGVGSDSGTFDFVNSDGGPRGFSYRTSDPPEFYYGGELFTTWSAYRSVDGCLFDAGSNSGARFDGDECTCVLLTDQVDGRGYFAVVSARANKVANTYLNQPNNAPIILRPLPRPGVTASLGESDASTADLALSLPPSFAGLYEKDGCSCGNAAYRIYGQLVPDGSAPPVDRRRDTGGWQLASSSDAELTASVPSALSLDCPAGSTMYLTSSLVFDSGFEVPFVSENSDAIQCREIDANAVDPPQSSP